MLHFFVNTVWITAMVLLDRTLSWLLFDHYCSTLPAICITQNFTLMSLPACAYRGKKIFQLMCLMFCMHFGLIEKKDCDQGIWSGLLLYTCLKSCNTSIFWVVVFSIVASVCCVKKLGYDMMTSQVWLLCIVWKCLTLFFILSLQTGAAAQATFALPQGVYQQQLAALNAGGGITLQQTRKTS